ncbi:MAG: DEAD/DEAH box helicase family protein [Puniceicoccales bacterium]|jgi:superfamily II DNA or RNA helicase|nr:DEAD/DEAH box helicase family protein [Puniceicoccales bacterium]
MRIKTLRTFQETAVASGVSLFTAAKRLLDVADAGHDVGGRARVVNHNGYLLIEAPTGSGKTLMAGCIVEKFTGAENLVWFWFAPFKGVVGQTEAFLREQFQALRLRDLATDRANEASRTGDTFVTTWQTVATRVKDRRNVRKESESNPSIDTLVESLRTQGLRIGVIVDEAHHGFGQDTQAAKFFHEVLRPEYTILITATPDDTDVAAFEKAMGIAELQRIRVSRADAVTAGLIKAGVKCAAYCVTDPAKLALVDLQATALRDGVAAHRKLKAQLARLKIPLVPLLLVQADSRERSVEKIKECLLFHGFTEEQIAVHTAAEPDDSLLALANDDRREVLVFKMAVALGFDAPRAFTLVSMRAARDPDFGVQLIGRLLRVHRLLQNRALAQSQPEELNYGYVFLSDLEAQDGLDKAGQRINAIQTEYAKASTTLIALRVDGNAPAIGTVAPGGQIEFSLTSEPLLPPLGGDEGTASVAPIAEVPAGDDFDFASFFQITAGDNLNTGAGGRPLTAPAATVGPSPSGKYRYKLRPGVPRAFKTQSVGADNEVTEEDCARQFTVSVGDLFAALINRVPVEKRTLEVFTHEIQQEFNFAAELSAGRAAHLANKALCENQSFDPRELRRALLRKLADFMREKAMPEAGQPEKVSAFLNTILATAPQKLRDAQKVAIARNAEILDAEALPEELESDEPLPASARNIYGVHPGGGLALNTWEKSFASLLDRDPNNHVLWWHRNEPKKPWSVNVLMPDGRGFFPDFIIGIEGRPTEHHALLADPKLNFAREDEAKKVLAKHQVYGRVLILCQDNTARWLTVTWDEKRNKAVAETEFHFADAAGF